MALFSRRKSQEMYFDKEGNPRTLVYTGGATGGGVTTLVRDEKSLNKLWDYYIGEGTVFASLNITAFNTIMVGFNLVSDDDSAKEVIEKFFDYVDILNVLLENFTYSLIFGDSFIEIIFNKKKIPSNLHTVNPKTMYIETDEYGKINYYYQLLQGRKGDEIDPQFICHLGIFPRPDSPYHISLIEPSKDMIERKLRTDDAIANALWRHGFRKWVIKVGNKDAPQIPPDTVMRKLDAKFEAINEENEFVIPWFISIDPIDEKGIEGIEEYFNYFQSQLITGMMTLEEALGLGKGSTEATAKVKSVMYERMIRAYQMRVALKLEKEIINKVLESMGFEPGLVKVKFNSITEQDEALKAKWVAQILRERPDVFTINEIRSMFGYLPLEEGDEKIPTPEDKKPESDNKEKENEPKPEVDEKPPQDRDTTKVESEDIQ